MNAAQRPCETRADCLFLFFPISSSLSLSLSPSFSLFFFMARANAQLNASTRITARPKHNDKLVGTLRRGQVTRRMGPTKGAVSSVQSAPRAEYSMVQGKLEQDRETNRGH